MVKILGKNPHKEFLSNIKLSQNYKNGAFQNILPTEMIPKDVSVLDMVKEYFHLLDDRIPDKEIPTERNNLKNFISVKPVITWFGHSSYLIQVANKTILVDPVFSGHASPFSFMIKAFKGTNVYSVSDLPAIDILLLTHDHYDHLDFRTLLQLKNKVNKICCSLGVASHLVYWGFDKKIIAELDWWETKKFDNITLTATPARHFSGRTVKRAQTLWSAFVLEADGYQLFLGGDSGYGDHFQEIGKRFGGFDLALLECGQYNVKWPMIHMTPDQTVQANIDLRSKVLMPVHWSKFALAFHSWNEPPKRAVERAKQLSIKYTIPKIGQQVEVGGRELVDEWWMI